MLEAVKSSGGHKYVALFVYFFFFETEAKALPQSIN
jgi:hypothetical protein